MGNMRNFRKILDLAKFREKLGKWAKTFLAWKIWGILERFLDLTKFRENTLPC
jgi:hypothetical protein